jgi:hypothetical protein
MSDEHQTEADCLLRTGALYRARVGLHPPDGDADLVFAGLKVGAFSLFFGDAPIYHFDLDGRWQRAFIEGRHYLKGLDTTIHSIDRVREGANLVLKRRMLDEAESWALDAQVRQVAWSLTGELDAGRLCRQEPPADKALPLSNQTLRGVLSRIAAWDAPAWDDHRKLYQAAYGPLPFLTPDCQNAVVLQATQGSASGASFGAGPVFEHSVHAPQQFERHARDVARLMGRRLMQTRLAFLAGSDLLRRPAGDVIAYLETLSRVFSIVPKSKRNLAPRQEEAPVLEGIHTFLDDFSPPRPAAETLRAYHDRHLIHAGLGIESGDTEIRRRYGKTWDDDDLRAIVADLKSAGFGLSLLTLVGAGGSEFGRDHVDNTAQLVHSLELARGDMVFLLDENEVRDPASSWVDFDPLTGSAWDQQQEQMKQALASLRERGVKVLPYSLEKQWA